MGTESTNMPMAMQAAAMSYWNGVYAGNAERIGSVLADDVAMESFNVVDGTPQPLVKLEGKEQVVETAMKMHAAIQSVIGFGLRFHSVSEDKLLVEYGQNLELSASSSSASSSSETVEMHSRGVQLWTAAESDEDILFVACHVFENDVLSRHVSEEEISLKIVFKLANINPPVEPAASGLFQKCIIA